MHVKRINKSCKRGVQRYTYYTAGQRVKKTVGATTSLFMYDEGGQLLGKYDGAGNALYETVYLDEQPVAVLKPDASGYKAYTSMPTTSTAPADHPA